MSIWAAAACTGVHPFGRLRVSTASGRGVLERRMKSVEDLRATIPLFFHRITVMRDRLPLLASRMVLALADDVRYDFSTTHRSCIAHVCSWQ